jgi:hypothetical protein
MPASKINRGLLLLYDVCSLVTKVMLSPFKVAAVITIYYRVSDKRKVARSNERTTNENKKRRKRGSAKL